MGLFLLWCFELAASLSPVIFLCAPTALIPTLCGAQDQFQLVGQVLTGFL